MSGVPAGLRVTDKQKVNVFFYGMAIKIFKYSIPSDVAPIPPSSLVLHDGLRGHYPLESIYMLHSAIVS